MEAIADPWFQHILILAVLGFLIGMLWGKL